MLNQADQARVANAIARAESATSGEIFCILATHVQRYPTTAVVVAMGLGLVLPFIAALAGYPPWLLASDDWATGPTPAYRIAETLLIAQLATAAVLGALIWLTRLDRALTPRSETRARLHAVATEQFRARGLADTQARTGVLIFASAPDRYAEVIADAGIHAHVGTAHWQATVAALVAAARAGDLAGGFERAVALAGEVLARHFPIQPGDVNELPDRLVQLD